MQQIDLHAANINRTHTPRLKGTDFLKRLGIRSGVAAITGGVVSTLAMAPSKPAGMPASLSAAAMAVAQSPQGSGKAGGAGCAAVLVAAGRCWRAALGGTGASGAASAHSGAAASSKATKPIPSNRLAAPLPDLAPNALCMGNP